MIYGVDTNFLLSFCHSISERSSQAAAVSRHLSLAGHTFCCCAQNVAEFWNVSTRPVDRNGFGKSVEATNSMVNRIEQEYAVLYETDVSFQIWRKLVREHRVRGIQVHDARIAATLLASSVSHLLTYNVSDFRRYSALKAMHPDEVAS